MIPVVELRKSKYTRRATAASVWFAGESDIIDGSRKATVQIIPVSRGPTGGGKYKAYHVVRSKRDDARSPDHICNRG